MMKRGFKVVVFCPVFCVRHQEQLKPSDLEVQSNEGKRKKILIFSAFGAKNPIFFRNFFLVRGGGCLTRNFFRKTFVHKRDIASFQYPRKHLNLKFRSQKFVARGFKGRRTCDLQGQCRCFERLFLFSSIVPRNPWRLWRQKIQV